jgi:small GTP-binding protein
LSSSSSVSASASLQEEYGLYRLLGVEERKLLTEQRRLTEAARQIASQVGGNIELFDKSKQQFLGEFDLDSTFAVVIAGEFNAGKSTLINALLGRKLLEAGSLPTTDSITIVTTKSSHDQGQEEPTSHLPSGVILHFVPNFPLLEDLTLVDTPGTNAVLMDHTARTLRLLPSADLILFVTSADRPFPESERLLLKSIQAYRKSIVIIINKMDILDTSGGDHGKEQKQKMVDFVTDNASELLGARPMVLPVSSRDALSAKLMSTKREQGEQQHLSNVWNRSNFAGLESFLKDTLTTQAKLKSKLSSPIGVAEGVMAQCLETLRGQQKDLETDVATLDIFESQFMGWKKELSADLAQSRREMTSMVSSEGFRCEVLLHRIKWHEFFRWALSDMARLEQEWEETKSILAVARSQGLEQELLEQVQETA